MLFVTYFVCISFVQATLPSDSEPHWLLWTPVQVVRPSLCPVGGVQGPHGFGGRGGGSVSLPGHEVASEWT